MGRIYEEVTATRKDIGTLDGKVEQALRQGADHESRIRALERSSATVEALEARDEKRDEQRDSRLLAVERRAYMVAGGLSAAGVGASVVISLLRKH